MQRIAATTEINFYLNEWNKKWNNIYQIIQQYMRKNNLDMYHGLMNDCHQLNQFILFITNKAASHKLTIHYHRKIVDHLQNILLGLHEYPSSTEICHALQILVDEVQKKILFFLKLNQPSSSMLASLPPEILSNIASCLSAKVSGNLLNTCGYFAHSPHLQAIRNEKIHNAWQLAVGGDHTLLLHQESKRLYGVGKNDKGQLGLGYKNTHSPGDATYVPQHISLASPPKQIIAGYQYSLILCENGSLYGFGDNSKYQLGLIDPSNLYIVKPVQINFPQNDIPKKVVTTQDPYVSYTTVLCESNRLYVFGMNPNKEARQTPTLMTLPIEHDIPITLVAGGMHTFIICSNGHIYGFGNNSYNQLGLKLGVKFQCTPTLIPFEKFNIQPIKISAGYNHTLILCESGCVYGLGFNYNNQLGCFTLGLNFNRISLPPKEIPLDIQAGGHTSFILCKNNKIYAFGDNRYGQLGLGRTWTPDKPQLIFDSNKSPLGIFPSGTHTFILCKYNKLYGFGSNHYGQLGIGNITKTHMKQNSIPLLQDLDRMIEKEELNKLEQNKYVLSYKPR